MQVFLNKFYKIMGLFSQNIVNQRFRIAYNELEKTGKIKGKSDLARHLETYNHVINNVLKGDRNITVDQINTFCEKYGINTNFLFGLSDDMFDEAGGAAPNANAHYLRDSDFNRRPNITLVPQKALAGYALSLDDKSFLSDLQQFSIPGMEGKLIAFEILGDSMLPNITNGDIVICEPLERDEPLKDNNVYVIVTDVVAAKRIQQIKDNENQLKALRLISDNDTTYKPYVIDLAEVRQILRVKRRVTAYGIS